MEMFLCARAGTEGLGGKRGERKSRLGARNAVEGEREVDEPTAAWDSQHHQHTSTCSGSSVLASLQILFQLNNPPGVAIRWSISSSIQARSGEGDVMRNPAVVPSVCALSSPRSSPRTAVCAKPTLSSLLWSCLLVIPWGAMVPSALMALTESLRDRARAWARLRGNSRTKLIGGAGMAGWL